MIFSIFLLIMKPKPQKSVLEFEFYPFLHFRLETRKNI